MATSALAYHLSRKTNRRAHSKAASGSMLTVVALLTMMLFCIAASIFSFMGVLMGQRELQAATDAGTLAVARQAITGPSISLQSGTEQQNFSPLLDPTTNKLTLLTYNRVVAQLLLVSLNASAEGTPNSLSNAQTLAAAVQSGSGSISGRLSTALSSGTSAGTTFNYIAGGYPLTMFGLTSPAHLDDQFQVAYLKKQTGLTNVYIDQSILPTGSATFPGVSSQNDASGFPYLNGYTNLTVGQVTVQATPLQPGNIPHLVNQTTFANDTNSPSTAGIVPPNAFQSSCSSLATVTNSSLVAQSSAIASSLSNTYSASIPGGYLVIAYGGTTGPTDTIAKLLTDAGDTNGLIQNLLVQRMREILPTATATQAASILANFTLKPGQTAYINLNSGALSASTNMPGNYSANDTADGQTFQVQSSGGCGNGWGGSGIAYCTPSSGFDNLLGSVTIQL